MTYNDIVLSSKNMTRNILVLKLVILERLNLSMIIDAYELVYKGICKSMIENNDIVKRVGLFNQNDKYIGANVIKDYNMLNDYQYFKEQIPQDIFKLIINRKQNRKNKRNRTDRKIIKMIRLANGLSVEMNIKTNIVFGTLTLDDKTLSQKEDTYMRKISKYLKSHYFMTILNKDYGKKNEREHYHFIALTSQPLEKINIKSKTGRELYKLKTKDYQLGFEPTLEIVNLNDKEKVRNYLLKLNNHSNKSTTKSSRFRVLYNDYISKNTNAKYL